MQPLELAKTRKRERIPQGVRFDVFRRDNFTCIYCGRGSPDVTLHCDHKLAHSKGGSDDKENLVTACEDCNFGKGAKSVSKPAIARSRGTNDSGLVGLFGHTRNDDGSINWQFEIIGKINDDTYTIQLFSWLDGGRTDVKMLSVANLMDCSLYATREDWIWAWAKESAREDGRDLKWAEGTFYLATGRRYGEAA
jgi:hypothetical protein